MTTRPLTTSQNRELLVAFVSYDGPSSSPQGATVTGSGLTWTLVKRSNDQAGTTYHGSLTAIAFTNASGPGIVNQTSPPTGPPDIYLPGVSAGKWVFAVGNDWDKAIARTPVIAQGHHHRPQPSD
jgi:hypothetical protein